MEWAKNWVVDKVAGYAKTGIQAGGTLAGNAVGGVGSLIEGSGRSVGQSTSGIAGAIGGVGGYINNYGDGIKNSMAADGPVGGGSASKKTAVKPTTQAVKRTADGTQKTATKALPATASKATTTTTSKSLASSNKTTPSSPKPAALPSKPPQPTHRVLPAKKPIPNTTPAVTRPPAAKPVPTTSSIPSTGTTPHPPISTRQSERTPDGKVKIASSARPGPVKPHTNSPTTPLAKLAASNEASSRPTPVRAPISTRLSPTREDGKVRISAESRPRPVKAN